MKSIKYIVLLMSCLCFAQLTTAQKVLSEEEAIALGIKNSHLLQAASHTAQEQKRRQGTGFNLSNPEITIESPTADFMTVGVLQSFEFPSVYVRRSKVLKEKSSLAQTALLLSRAEVIQKIKSMYLQLQFDLAMHDLYATQDSLYAAMAQSAKRKFEAGQIDFIEKSFASTKYGESHMKFLQATIDVEFSMQQLQVYTGLQDSLLVSPLKQSREDLNSISIIDSNIINTSAFSIYYKKSEMISRRELQVEKSKALPGFSFGYLNQGPKDSDFPLRLRGGINIPIWFWQYRASIRAAKENLKASEQMTMAQTQNLSSKVGQEKTELIKNREAIIYFDQSGLKEADEIISASIRMFEAGSSDYVDHLRILSDAYNIRINYIEAVKNYNQSQVNLNYLIGQP